jgi:hypothetical protein
LICAISVPPDRGWRTAAPHPAGLLQRHHGAAVGVAELQGDRHVPVKVGHGLHQPTAAPLSHLAGPAQVLAVSDREQKAVGSTIRPRCSICTTGAASIVAAGQEAGCCDAGAGRVTCWVHCEPFQ